MNIVMGSAAADYLRDWERTPEGAVFELVEVDCFYSNDYEDRIRYSIRYDDCLYSAVFYSGSIDSYWESAISGYEMGDYRGVTIGG